MSLALGGIEREIARRIKAARMPVRLSSWTLAYVFKPNSAPWGWTPSRSQRASVVRAMHSFVRKHPQYAMMGGKGRKELVFYDTADPVSVAWARLTIATRGNPPSLMDARAFMQREESGEVG